MTVARDERAAVAATCASARNPSIFGSNTQSGWSNGSGMQRRRIGLMRDSYLEPTTSASRRP